MKTILIPTLLLALAGCATAPAPDLERLHTDLTTKEGTAHYDEWSPRSQRQWERAFEATIER